MASSNLVAWKTGTSLRFQAFQDLTSDGDEAPSEFRNVDPMGHQPAGLDEVLRWVDRWQTALLRQLNDQRMVRSVYILIA